MNEITKELLEALQALVNAAWKCSHAVELNGTATFGKGYDSSGLNGCQRTEFRDELIEFVVWPSNGKWSAYSTYEGFLWFEHFETEDEARKECMKLLSSIVPDHQILKARAAITKAEAALAATQPSYWILWEGGDCPVAPGTCLDVEYRDGERAYNVPAGGAADGAASRNAIDWSRRECPFDIVAYRVAKP